MKKTFFSIILLLLGFTTATAAIKHPSLLFTPQRVESAKKALKTDTALQAAWQKILEVADGKADVRKLEYPALAYQMTGDKKYAEKIKETLLKTAKVKSWGDAEMLARRPAWRSELQMAHKSFQLALAYDAVYSYLTPSERKEIADGLYRLAVGPSWATGLPTTPAFTH